MKVIHVVLDKANPGQMSGVNKVVHELATQQAMAGTNVTVWNIAKDITSNSPEQVYKTVVFKESVIPFTLSAASESKKQGQTIPEATIITKQRVLLLYTRRPGSIKKIMSKRIVAVHLLNDRSSSTLVLREALTTLVQNNEVVLLTATPSDDGLLSGIPGVSCQAIFYKRSRYIILNFLYQLLCQLLLLLRLLVLLRKSDMLYINTLYPAGAALAGMARGSKIIYHVHETSIKPALLRWLLASIAELAADKVIFVSAYLSGQYKLSRKKTIVVHSVLSACFIRKSEEVEKNQSHSIFTVSMLCSLKAYKGIYQFLHLARHLPNMRFILALNCPVAEADRFIKKTHPPQNCTVYPAQPDTTAIYAATDVVVNLSDPRKWIEPFGMTILEAMQWGIPVIAPAVGGVLEMVENNVNGYTIHCDESDELCAALIDLQNDTLMYEFMSAQAKATARRFNRDNFSEKIKAIFA